MTPREVAAVLREISQLLQLKGENAFKVRAYDMGADAFETLPPDPAASGGLYERVKAGTLSELEGVGKAIDQKVTELVNTGKLEYLEKLRLDFPRGALDLVQIPGLGPRKAAILIRELDVVNLDDLEKAAHAGRVRVLKGCSGSSPRSCGCRSPRCASARQRESRCGRRGRWRSNWWRASAGRPAWSGRRSRAASGATTRPTATSTWSPRSRARSSRSCRRSRTLPASPKYWRAAAPSAPCACATACRPTCAWSPRRNSPPPSTTSPEASSITSSCAGSRATRG